jgi:catechol 2,3-dioxygenase-like lactoylglutathione lyase family enzyme
MASSSLIGQLPLAAIWLRCKDIDESRRFYGKVLGFRVIDHENGSGPLNGNAGVHFDLGTVRLTLLPQEETVGKYGKNGTAKIATSDQLVFVVENSIDAVQTDLLKRGVKMKSKRIVESHMGKTAWFTDPDGHTIYLWQPPRRESKNFEEVKDLVEHYESVSRALADLREIDDGVAEELEREANANRSQGPS